MGIFSFSKVKKQILQEIIERACALGYQLDPSDVDSKETESGHWVFMPRVLWKESVIYEDGAPVDRERAMMPFAHVQEQYPVRFKFEHSKGLFSPKLPEIEPEGYEIVVLEWSLVAVIAPDGQVSWGQVGFTNLLTDVYHMETQEKKLSYGLQRQANSKLSIQWLSREGKITKYKGE